MIKVVFITNLEISTIEGIFGQSRKVTLGIDKLIFGPQPEGRGGELDNLPSYTHVCLNCVWSDSHPPTRRKHRIPRNDRNNRINSKCWPHPLAEITEFGEMTEMTEIISGVDPRPSTNSPNSAKWLKWLINTKCWPQAPRIQRIRRNDRIDRINTKCRP